MLLLLNRHMSRSLDDAAVEGHWTKDVEDAALERHWKKTLRVLRTLEEGQWMLLLLNRHLMTLL